MRIALRTGRLPSRRRRTSTASVPSYSLLPRSCPFAVTPTVRWRTASQVTDTSISINSMPWDFRSIPFPSFRLLLAARPIRIRTSIAWLGPVLSFIPMLFGNPFSVRAGLSLASPTPGSSSSWYARYVGETHFRSGSPRVASPSPNRVGLTPLTSALAALLAVRAAISFVQAELARSSAACFHSWFSPQLRGPTSFSGSTSTRPTPAKASGKARRSAPTARGVDAVPGAT